MDRLDILINDSIAYILPAFIFPIHRRNVYIRYTADINIMHKRKPKPDAVTYAIITVGKMRNDV